MNNQAGSSIAMRMKQNRDA